MRGGTHRRKEVEGLGELPELLSGGGGVKLRIYFVGETVGQEDEPFPFAKRVREWGEKERLE